jgi:hypothetical protein
VPLPRMKSRLQNAFIEAGVLCILKLRKILFIPSSTDVKVCTEDQNTLDELKAPFIRKTQLQFARHPP